MRKEEGSLDKVSSLSGGKRDKPAHRTNKASDKRMDITMTTTARIRKKKQWRTLGITRIACWNVTSLNNKDQELLLEMNKHKIDICGIAETKKKGKGNMWYDNYILIYSGKKHGEYAKSGVGILLHEKYENYMSECNYINDRIVKIVLETNDIKTHIISVYAPDINKSQEERTTFYNDLQRTLDGVPKKDHLILLGDFNARIGNQVIHGVKNKYNEDIINENGELLIHMCAQNELRINNTFYPHKPQHKYTFENSQGQKSMIDFIITNRNFHPTQILDVRVLTSANVGTQHNLVLCKLRNTTPPTKKKEPLIIEKLNIESLNNTSTQNLYQQRLKNKISTNRIDENDNSNTAFNKLRINIISAAQEAIGQRKTNINKQRKPKPWFTPEIKLLANEKKRA